MYLFQLADHGLCSYAVFRRYTPGSKAVSTGPQNAANVLSVLTCGLNSKVEHPAQLNQGVPTSGVD